MNVSREEAKSKYESHPDIVFTKYELIAQCESLREKLADSKRLCRETEGALKQTKQELFAQRSALDACRDKHKRTSIALRSIIDVLVGD